MTVIVDASFDEASVCADRDPQFTEEGDKSFQSSFAIRAVSRA
jgi:hypothetical protein